MAGKAFRRTAVIMAGGSGERFWPLSRQGRPKQLLRLASPNATLIEEAIERVLPMLDPGDIHISTTTPLLKPIRSAKLGIPAQNVIAEPCRRNTAGCLSWVAGVLMARSGGTNVTMAVLTSDHRILSPGKFRTCIRSAMTAAERTGALVTIGIKPTRAETGYGYIEAGGRMTGKNSVPVVRFREKPNHELAQEFLESGRHYWNSGMFFWTIESFLREMETASPEHAEATRAIAAALTKRRPAEAQRAFEKLPDISIDYALMEKSQNVRMVTADFPWDDVGAWDALDRTRPGDQDGNVLEGDPVLIDSENCIIVNDAGADKIAVGIVGVENLIVIVTEDSVLVVPKSHAQDVRQIVRELKTRGMKQV